MAKLSRVGDINEAGGSIVNGASTVFANGIKVGVHTSLISPHGRRGHRSSTTTDGSPSVFAEGKPVLRVGSGNSCGHTIIQGSPDVNVP